MICFLFISLESWLLGHSYPHTKLTPGHPLPPSPHSLHAYICLFKHIYNLGLFSLGWNGLGWGPQQYVHPILNQRNNFLCKMLIQCIVSWCISNALFQRCRSKTKFISKMWALCAQQVETPGGSWQPNREECARGLSPFLALLLAGSVSVCIPNALSNALGLGAPATPEK